MENYSINVKLLLVSLYWIIINPSIDIATLFNKKKIFFLVYERWVLISFIKLLCHNCKNLVYFGIL